MEIGKRMREENLGYGVESDALLQEQQEMHSLFFRLRMDQRAALLDFMRTLSTKGESKK
jgi:hypothetical protein